MNTPLCGLSQVNAPPIGGLMTSGELVLLSPTSRALTMAGSNRSSMVIAGVGVGEPNKSSTPWDRPEPGRQPVT